MKRFVLSISLAAMCAGLCACGSQADTYREAFSQRQALSGNSTVVLAQKESVWHGVNQTLIGQGFTIRQADTASGLITAEREMADPSDSELSYDVTATANVVEQSKNKVEVELAANQKTVRHQKYHTWWHLLWLVPIFPTGTEYNTVVRRESTVTDTDFYADFFAALNKRIEANSAAQEQASAAQAAPASAAPAAVIASDQAAAPAAAAPPPSAAVAISAAENAQLAPTAIQPVAAQADPAHP